MRLGVDKILLFTTSFPVDEPYRNWVISDG
jgi:hypothetical protein